MSKKTTVERPGAHYVLPDRSVGDPGGPNPLAAMSWQELRDEIYGVTRDRDFSLFPELAVEDPFQ